MNWPHPLPVLLIAAAALFACEAMPAAPVAGSGQPDDAAHRGAGVASQVLFTANDRPTVVDVVSNGMTLEAPASIPAGWTTFRYTNNTGLTHFFILEHMPPGKTVEDSRAEIVPVFQEGMDLIIAGKFDEALAAFGKLPAWSAQVVYEGGPGLTAPGRTSETTVRLEPGTYTIECYVKTPDGTFHSALGMIAGLVVTDELAGTKPPAPTLEVTLTNAGMMLDGRLRPGRHTIAVHFAEQMLHEHFLGHDIHLARIDEDTDLDALAAWMNWSSLTGLSTPAPAEFLGGTQEMPAGRTAYFDALLRPGRYALIAEVPDPAGKNLLKTFTVPRH